MRPAPEIANPLANLAVLAGAINAEHEAAENSARSALEHAHRAGELLIQAKADCGHGDWLAWLTANVRVKPRMAQNYMRLAKEWAQLETENTQRVAHLSVRDALSQITASVARLAQCTPEVQDKALLALETTRQNQTVNGAVRDARLAERLQAFQRQATPQTFDTQIFQNDRPARVLHQPEFDLWRLELGPNCTVATYENAVEHAKEEMEFAAFTESAERMEQKAATLRDRAAELEKEAHHWRSDARDLLRDYMHQKHADLCPYREQYEFAPLPEDRVSKLKASKQAAAAKLLIEWLTDSKIQRVAIQGNTSWPSSPPGFKIHCDGWYGIGFEACADTEATT